MFGYDTNLRRRAPSPTTPPEANSNKDVGSGTVPTPRSVSIRLSIALLLSFGESPFRKSSSVELPVAVNVCVNCCQTNRVGLAVELVSEKVGVALMEMLTVLATPYPGADTFPT